MIFTLIAQMYSLQSWASGVRIIDADTIELNGAKVRLYGIDAPEILQECEDVNFKCIPVAPMQETLYKL